MNIKKELKSIWRGEAPLDTILYANAAAIFLGIVFYKLGWHILAAIIEPNDSTKQIFIHANGSLFFGIVFVVCMFSGISLKRNLGNTDSIGWRLYAKIMVYVTIPLGIFFLFFFLFSVWAFFVEIQR